MEIMKGIIAGLIAGGIMGCFSQAGYLTRLIKSHLIVIDGEFALRKLKLKANQGAIYLTGILIHLVTSLIFGAVYVILAELLGFEARNALAITVYVLILWLAMLFAALPIAGQEFLGRKTGKYAWIEQLILHGIFGISFWWAIGII